VGVTFGGVEEGAPDLGGDLVPQEAALMAQAQARSTNDNVALLVRAHTRPIPCPASSPAAPLIAQTQDINSARKKMVASGRRRDNVWLLDVAVLGECAPQVK
jgi:hypothetical protein